MYRFTLVNLILWSTNNLISLNYTQNVKKLNDKNPIFKLLFLI